MNKTLPLVAIGTVFLVGGCGISYADNEKHDERSFQAPERQLVIDTNYDVSVETGGDKVFVERRIAEGAEASWSLKGDTLRLRVDDLPTMNFGTGYESTVRVPEGLQVVVRTADADVEAEGVSEGIEVENQNGDVRLTDISGNVSVESTNGDINVEASGPPEEAKLTTQNGDVDLELPGAEAYRVRADTTTGDVNVSVDKDRDSDRIVDVRTTNGDINVRPS